MAHPCRSPREPRRTQVVRALLLLFGAAALIAAASLVFATRISGEMADFDVYRVAGGRAVAGEPLFRADDGHWQFKYLPAFALAVAPLSRLPAEGARAIWFGLSLLALVALLNRSLALLPDRRRGQLFLVGLTTVAMAKFYLHELNLGQSNLLMAVLVLGALTAWRHDRHAAAGLLLAAAAVVKPYAIVFVPYLVVRRRWRGLLAWTLAIAAALLVPALRYGWSGNLALLREWWVVVSTSTAPNLLGQDNISLAGMYAAWLGIGPGAAWLAAITALLAIAAVGYAIVWRPAAPFPDYLDTAALLFIIPLLSPQGWDYVLLLSTPAVMVLLDRVGEFTRPERVLLFACLAVVGLTIWDVLGRNLYGAVMMSRALTICALIEVWLLLRLRMRGAA